MIITIDGPAGTGKSTVAKRLAAVLGFTTYDTGALYRALTWMVLKEGVDYRDENAMKRILSTFPFRVEGKGEEKRYFIGEVEVTNEIRTKEVTALVSEVSALKIVREALRPHQVEYAKSHNIVFEGRDLGTAIFPHADLKFFLGARAEIRAMRRFKELQEKFPDQSFFYETILKEIKERDNFDSSRKISPLKQAIDAHFIDTSELTIDEVVLEMRKIYEKAVSSL